MPAYNRETGRLERLTADRSGDGKIDTWAFMDGRRLERVEIDRDGDEAVDRVEHYEAQPSADPGAPFGGAVIVKAEEMAAPGRPVTRTEFYRNGLLHRVEEDVDLDGAVDKWEEHEGGRLMYLALDLDKRGFPTRRLIYGPSGVRAEIDPDGDGVFVPAPGDPEPSGKGREQ